MLIGVCVKQVDLRPEIDPLSGAAADVDPRFAGMSAADQAALEHALRLAEEWSADVVAVTAGPSRADAALRVCLAAGAHRAVRVDLDPDVPSREVAAALAVPLRGADVVCCGDWSLDRGSGSVPAFLAHELHAVQGLGLVVLEPAALGVLVGERRLDRGRRERLRLDVPAVVSVEAAGLTLRRAGLPAVLAAQRATIATAAAPARPPHPVRVVSTGPYRPRARVVDPPAPELGVRDRILALAGVEADHEPPRALTFGPEEAADVVLDRLRAWGHLDGPVP